MIINVEFLGPAKDLAKSERVTLDVPEGACVADVRRAIGARFPAMRDALGSMRLAVNQAFVPDGFAVRADDEVAVIPPVSGGSDDGSVWVDMVAEPLPFERVRAFVSGDRALGGIVTFEGATRAEHDDEHGPLTRLDYEAYDGMARRQFARIARAALERWNAGKIAIVHRVGPVRPGEVSVMIAVACGHRAEAFEACRWLIDTLKKDVPIWKKDVFEDGFVRWVEPGAAKRSED